MLSSTQILPLEAPPTNWNPGPIPPPQVTDHEINPVQPLATVPSHTTPIGIIHPPPDIRTIIEITAKFVSEKGPDYEKLIKSEQSNNANFNFLNNSLNSPYHAYYQYKLAEYRTNGLPPQPDVAAKTDVQDQFRILLKPIEPPEPEKYIVKLPEGITCEEIDTIKLTAQFVARNGKPFLNGLLARENNNPQFRFMNPTNRLFTLFTGFVDAYSEVLVCGTGKKAVDLTTVLERCLHRLGWDCYQEGVRKKEEEDRVKIDMIDWHDFAVVESIDFADEEDVELPLPMSLDEAIRKSTGSSMEEEVVMEMDMDEEEVKLVDEANMRIVKNWKRPEDRIFIERDLTRVVISPISGEMVPINEMSEHMRISLIDPKFREQKDRMFAKIRESTLAGDDEIAKNIVGLARLRPDIFGTTEEEVSNAVKAEIDKKETEQPKQVIVDSVYSVPNSFPVPAALPPYRTLPPLPNLAANIPYPPAYVQYPGAPRPLGVPVMQLVHQQHQFLMPGHPLMMNQPQAPRPYGQLPPPVPGMPSPPPPLLEEPEPKRQKFDESSLVPEEQFLAKHPGLVTIRVCVPSLDDGQIIDVRVESLSEKVISLKEKIAGEMQIPANKQKLSGKVGFLKDNVSLAYYNVGAGDILTLSLRERGGRKR